MVEGAGFEPAKAEPSDLQSDPFGRSGTPPKRGRIFNAPSCTVKLFLNKILRLARTTAAPPLAIKAQLRSGRHSMRTILSLQCLSRAFVDVQVQENLS